ncbi:MAG: gliding motility protein RemB [Bacteroidota bacterium]
MKQLPSYCYLLVTLLLPLLVMPQQQNPTKETYPVFEECSDQKGTELAACFQQTLQQKLHANYQEPELVAEKDYQGKATVIFEVDKNGAFGILYIDAAYDEIKQALQAAFNQLPTIQPATYNARPTYFQFRMVLPIPIKPDFKEEEKPEVIIQPQQQKIKNEWNGIKTYPYQNDRDDSGLSIPFSHEVYSRFDQEMNRVGTNAHTASKPYRYKEVKPYYNITEENQRLMFDKKTWFGRKFFNENTARVKGDNYWFTFDIAADLQAGRDFEKDFTTYNNTRAVVFQGGITDKLTFYTSFFESQGKFAGYYNDLAENLGREGSSLVMIPGRGTGEPFKGSAYDYPVVEAYLNYQVNDFLDIQFGKGNNFIGDGYRSLFMSDNASPNAYVKMNTSFWKFKYTNTWSSIRNPNTLTDGGAYTTKYMATHYLSYNVTERLNLGLFETVLFESEGNRGFDWNFMNPVILYHTAEYATGSQAGKAILGLSYKYKWSDKLNTYGQLLIDELSVSDVAAMNKSWKNKFGLQLGLKYYDAFKVDNLFLQLEYNQVRPYTYSHNTLSLHYTHNNQSMAHLWGANFRELLAIIRYRKDRYYGHAKFIFGERGFEPEADSNPFYGSDLFGDERDRVGDENQRIGQGNRAHSLYGELEIGYLLNPTTNLKVYLSLIHRDFDIANQNEQQFDRSTTWINLGFRTDLFNWYYDY